MKRVLLAAIVFVAVAAHAGTGRGYLVNEKVQKAFEETFVTATDVTWKELAETFIASFKEKEAVKTVAEFTKEGKLRSTIRYYGEEQLPPFLLSRIKEKYTDKTILGITELSSETEVKFVITMEDKKKIYKVESDILGNAEITDRMLKQ